MRGVHDMVGQEFGPTAWREVTQERVNLFAEATDDPQWIHTDPVRAAVGPFGTTIVHGFLTLSLLVPLSAEAWRPEGYRMSINYGVNKVRFPAPVPVGSRIRARFTVLSVEKTPAGDRAVVEATVEREGGDRPVCVAELVSLFVP